MTEKNLEGWTWIIGTPKWHYMRKGFSLCGKWMLLGNPTLEQGKPFSLDNCKACKKKLFSEYPKKEKKTNGSKKLL
jgi:hypothetical protein